MKYLDTIFENKIIDEPTAVTVGKFDGIHKGHNLLANRILEKETQGFASCMVTFLNSPRIALKKDEAPCLITNEEREVRLQDMGVKYLVECPFDEKLMHTSPKDFIKALVDNLNMKYMVVGSDFRFGFKGLGDVELLKEISKELDFELEVIQKIQKDNRDISSTFIREELSEGNIDLVNDMLGYNYFVWGTVVHGAHLGSKIGIPTIILLPPSNKLVPKFGVYVTTIEIRGRVYHGVTNVGMKPTVSDSNQVGIETHILDFNDDLYDEQVKVVFEKFIRPEMKFASVEELTYQMNLDKRQAYNYFNK